MGRFLIDNIVLFAPAWLPFFVFGNIYFLWIWFSEKERVDCVSLFDISQKEALISLDTYTALKLMEQKLKGSQERALVVVQTFQLKIISIMLADTSNICKKTSKRKPVSRVFLARLQGFALTQKLISQVLQVNTIRLNSPINVHVFARNQHLCVTRTISKEQLNLGDCGFVWYL